jgi:hypothetical protein
MKIKTKLSEKDFINVNFVMFYSNLLLRILMIMFALFLIISFVMSFFVDQISLLNVISFALLLTIWPVIIYFSSKKNYKSNLQISELIEYDFDKESLHVKGESFESKLLLNKIYKVSLVKNWLLLFQSKQIANIIPRRDISSQQITDLRSILNEQGVKNNL